VVRRDEAGGKVGIVEQFGLEIEGDIEFTVSQELADGFETAGAQRPFRVDEELAAGPASTLVRSAGPALRQLEAAVVHPLTGRSGLMGFLVLGRRLLAEGYSSRDLELLASLAELYTMALERAGSPAPLAQRPHSYADAHPDPTADEVQSALEELRERYPSLQSILGESPALLELFSDLVQFADSRATILIQGESGTGKELVAKAIHALSRRRNAPFEVVDCSSIPKELIESELFGHVRGAFTGAVRDRRGAFDLAHQGSLFLDEIGDMTLASQTRLLRVLQEGKFRPVGGEKTHSVDVRVIAATNVNLHEAVTRGTFRKDLFYRIQVFPLRLPPLRERRGDIEVLTRTFLKRFYADFGRPEPMVDPEVLTRLARHTFPGNVRELQNIVEALAIRSRGEGHVRRQHLREVFRSQRISTEPAESPQHEGADKPATSPAPYPLPGGSVQDPAMGPRTAAAWRDAGFNLLEASRRLRARRLDGESIPVVDRVQLSHYLDGEILATFERSGSVSATIEQMSLDRPHQHRAAKRIRRVLTELAQALARGDEESAFPRLPDEYRPALVSLAARGESWLEERLQEEPGGD
jgi:transcriptional regulator with GAF, ATPase, and Fis domain